MKKMVLLLCAFSYCHFLFGQNINTAAQQRGKIETVINQYAQAREKGDTILLKSLLMPDIDQLVSNGEWRNGIGTAVRGMQQSSSTNPGARILQVDKMRMLNAATAIVDCRYEIRQTAGTDRRMWSTFILVKDRKSWKITAIRNMLPADQ